MTHLKKRVRGWVVPISLTLFVFILMKAFFFVGYVPTASMEPTLKAGSYIFGIRNTSKLETGDIIVFHHDGQLLVKRIAGCPGDPIDRTKISYMASVPIPIFEQAVITVPENAYFLLGDNAENSWDSRYWDDPFIPSDAVVAKLIGYS